MLKFAGSELKIIVTAEMPDGLHMEDVDFECEIYNRQKFNRRINFRKEDMKQVDADHYMCLVDSAVLGVGEYAVKLTAYIPDSDFPDRLRTEVTKFPVEVLVKG